MSISVEKMLQFENFCDFKILAGSSGIQRKITSVSVMDAPDLHKWVKGGEFFLTTGYCMKDDPKEIEELIIKINNLGASAFGIKLNRFIDVLPEKVIETANKLAFPIIQIPHHFAFIDIINPILITIINEQGKRLQHSENVHKSLTQLVINGGDTQQIINTLRDILKIDVAFYDTYHDKVYIKVYSNEFSNNIKLLELDEMLLVYSHYPINIDKKNYGYIIISTKISKDGSTLIYDEIAIEHASTVLKLEIQKKISNMQVEERYRGEFVRDLIINNINTIEEVRNRSKLYGWDFSTGLVSIIVDIDNFKIQYLKVRDKEKNYTLESTKLRIFETAIKIIKKDISQVVYTTLSDSIIFLVKCPYEERTKFFKRLKKTCEEICVNILNYDSFTVTIGIGNYEKSVMNIHENYGNAKRAVKLGRIIYKCNRVIFYDDLGVYKLLALIYKSDDAKEFYLSNLQKLIDYDMKKNGDLLNTLRYIVQNNWNLKATSNDMYVHYNTIKYRFNKINELVNVNLRNPEEKINIVISLKLMEMAE